MRIVTWNMGCGGRASAYRKVHDEAWAYLLEELRPDVALVQEAVVTKIDAARRDHAVIVCELAPRIDAGAAVLVRGFEASALPAPFVVEETYLAAAKVSTPAGALVVASVHVYPGKKQHAALQSLAEQAAVAFAAQAVVLAGDFNAARHFDTVYGGKRYQRFFDAMAERGFHEAHWSIHAREIQTFWGGRAKEKYQDDHFFISGAWASRVRSCTVIDDATVRRVSDHGPVLLELDVTAS